MKYTVWAMMLAVALAQPVWAGDKKAETPGIDKRQENQAERIEKGVESGKLTEREAGRLNARQEHIAEREEKAKADGVVTPAERRGLNRAMNRNSRAIAHQKHDLQGSNADKVKNHARRRGGR